MPAPASTITVQTAVAAVRRQFGDVDSIQITDDDIMAWINEACIDIVNNNPINEASISASTIVGVGGYDLPPDMYRSKMTVVVDGRVLELRSFQAAMTEYADDILRQGQPAVWYTYGNTLYVYPTPNQVVDMTIYYNKAPMKVSVVSDLLPVPDNYYTGVLSYVLSKAYELDEQPELMATQVNLYKEATQSVDNQEFPSTGTYPVIRDAEYEDDYVWL